MKSYAKTFRCSKVHKCKRCGVCSEDGNSATRRAAKEEIRNGDLRCENAIQSEHNEEEDWFNFCDNY